MNTIEWVNSVVGKPWRDRAAGLNSFDCWGLVIDYFNRIHSIELAEIDGYLDGEPIETIGATEAHKWKQIEKHGDSVVFCCFTSSGDMIHVGVIVDIYKAGYYAIHAAGKDNKGQVIAEPVHQLVRRYNLLKCEIKYYTRAN